MHGSPRSGFARRITSMFAGVAMAAGALVGAAAPAQATGEAFPSMSPTSGIAGAAYTFTFDVTLDTNTTSNSAHVQGGYYILLPGFDWSAISCANVTFSPALTENADSNLAGSCLGFKSAKGGLNFSSPYITGTATRSYTVTVTGLRAPNGTATVSLANWDASQVFGTQVFTGIAVSTDAPLDTLDFDGNGGTCTPNKIEGYRTTWAQALTADKCTYPDGRPLT